MLGDLGLLGVEGEIRSELSLLQLELTIQGLSERRTFHVAASRDKRSGV